MAQAVASAHSRVLQEIAHLHALAYVNNSQRDAIQAILCGNRAVQLVQGPPGSGERARRFWCPVALLCIASDPLIIS